MSDWRPQGCDYEGCLRVAVETVGVRYVCERHVSFRINEPKEKPPLVLPTEPTWGIALTHQGWGYARKWKARAGSFTCDQGSYAVREVLDFIPLTDEQVQRIEAAR